MPSFSKSLPVVLLVGASALAGPIARDQNNEDCTYEGKDYSSTIEQCVAPESNFCLPGKTPEETKPWLVKCWNTVHPDRQCTSGFDVCKDLVWGRNAVGPFPGPKPNLPGQSGPSGLPGGQPTSGNPGGPLQHLPAECLLNGREIVSNLDQILLPGSDFCLADLDHGATLKRALECFNKMYPEHQCNDDKDLNFCVWGPGGPQPGSGPSHPGLPPASGDPGHSSGGPGGVDPDAWWWNHGNSPLPPSERPGAPSSGGIGRPRPSDGSSGPLDLFGLGQSDHSGSGHLNLNVDLHNGDSSSHDSSSHDNKHSDDKHSGAAVNAFGQSDDSSDPRDPRVGATVHHSADPNDPKHADPNMTHKNGDDSSSPSAPGSNGHKTGVVVDKKGPQLEKCDGEKGDDCECGCK